MKMRAGSVWYVYTRVYVDFKFITKCKPSAFMKIYNHIRGGGGGGREVKEGRKNRSKSKSSKSRRRRRRNS